MKRNDVFFGLLFFSINLFAGVKTLKEQAAQAYVASRPLEAIKEDLDQNKLNAELQEVLVPLIINKCKKQISGLESDIFKSNMFNVRTFSNRNWDCWNPHSFRLVALSFDSRYALVGSLQSKIVYVYNVETGKAIKALTSHADNVYAIAFSPDNTQALTGSRDCTVRLWDLATGDTVKVLTGTSSIRSVVFSSDGTKALAGLEDGRACLWDLITGHLMRVFTGHGAYVGSVAFNSDGTQILTGSKDGKTLVWDISTGQLIKTIPCNGYTVKAVAFSTSGTQVLTGSSDGTVRLWDSTTNDIVTVFKRPEMGTGVSSIAFNQDRTRVVVGCRNGYICVGNLETAIKQKVNLFGAPIFAVAMGCGAKYILVGFKPPVVCLIDLCYANTSQLAEVLNTLIPLVNFKCSCSIM